MKKTIIALVALLIPLGILLCSCQPAKNLPYRVWESWDEMKEVLGDHYLYPTYLPEYAGRSKQATLRSYYNHIDRDLEADKLFHGYTVLYSGGSSKDDLIFIRANDGKRQNYVETYPSDLPPFVVPYDGRFQDSDHFYERIVTVGSIDIEFIIFYGEFSPDEGFDPDEWYEHHARNGRAVLYSFQIDTVTYTMTWTQYNVDDKNAYDEQREEMLKVAKSIIEQVAEVE